MPWLDPRFEPGAHDNPTSMGEPGGRPSSSQSSRLVTGEATPLAIPPTPESQEPPEVGRWMGGMVAVSSPYAGGVHGPSVGDAFLNCRGSYTSSEPNSLLIKASCPAVPISFGVAYSRGILGPGVLCWGCRCQSGYLEPSVEDVAMPVTFAWFCLCFCASCHSNGSCMLRPLPWLSHHDGPRPLESTHTDIQWLVLGHSDRHGASAACRTPLAVIYQIALRHSASWECYSRYSTR